MLDAENFLAEITRDELPSYEDIFSGPPSYAAAVPPSPPAYAHALTHFGKNAPQPLSAHRLGTDEESTV